MICGRFVFLIVYFAFSGFDSSYSLLAKFNLSNTNIIREKTLLERDVVNSVSKIYFKDRKIVDRTELERQKLVYPQLKTQLTKNTLAQERSLHAEAPSAINRLLGLEAMGVISALAVFLIWTLFSKPRQQQDNLGDEVKKLTVPGEVNQANTPVAQVDKIQQFIHTLEHLDNSDEPTSVQTALKLKAIWQLAKAANYYSIEPLLEVMPQAKALDRKLILEVVKQINQRNYQSINHQLFAALQHEKPEVRLKALRDLKNLYQFVSPAIAKIAQMHSDSDYEVRQNAIEILRSLNTSPLPTFHNYANSERKADNLDNLIIGKETGANLHSIAYLLSELDAEK
jgi:hypothetical protein